MTDERTISRRQVLASGLAGFAVSMLAGCETTHTHIVNGVVVSGPGRQNDILAQFRLADVTVNYPDDHRLYYVASVSREVFREATDAGLQRLWAAASPEGLSTTRQRISAHLTPHAQRMVAPLLTGQRPVVAVINIRRLLVLPALLVQSPDDMSMTATLELVDQQTGSPITETEAVTVYADGSTRILGQAAPSTGSNRFLSDIGDKFAVRSAGLLPDAALESATRFE